MTDALKHQMKTAMEADVEEMRKAKLYTYEESRFILKTRRDYESKINGVSKNLQDYKDYIQYEKVLLKQIQTRKDKCTIGDRKRSIEYKILKKIKNLYEIALQRYPNDFSFSLSYFKFCKQSNYTTAASVTIQKMLKNFCQVPEIWQIASSWLANDRNDLNSALNILHKGLTIHKNCQALYTFAIKLELSVIKNDTNNDNNQQLKEKVCQKIETYIKPISECIRDYNYMIEILNLLETYTFTDKVQNLIIKELIRCHSGKDFVWHTLAQREKRGLHYDLFDTCKDQSPLQRCIATYKEGLNKVSSNEKENLWCMYLDYLLDIQHENNETDTVIDKRDLLKKALEQACNENYLTEKYFIIWYQLVSKDEALNILEKGTRALPQSEDLWKLRLQSAISIDKTVLINQIFKEGTEQLKERSLPLWLMCLRYFNLLNREDIVEQIYKNGIKQPQEVSNALKPKYIEWLSFVKGISDARKMYNILANDKPYCKELHLAMSKLESTEIEYDFDMWSSVHELACKQFGEEDVDVWINHILFYLHFNKKNVNENVQRIRKEAETALQAMPFLLCDFKEKYNNVLSGQLNI